MQKTLIQSCQCIVCQNSLTSESLWNYHRGEIDDVNYNVSDGKSFKYKTKIIGKTSERPKRPPKPPQNPDGNQPT